MRVAHAAPQTPRVVELYPQTPLSNRLAGHRDAALGKQTFDISETQAETVVQLHGVTDDVRAKPAISLAGRLGLQRPALPVAPQLDNAGLIPQLDSTVSFGLTKYRAIGSCQRKKYQPMKRFALIVGSLAAGLVLLVLIVRGVGFNPGPTRPGMWLTGELVTEPLSDWSSLARSPGLTSIQTRNWFLPSLAHSVMIGRFHYKDRLYVASGYPAGIELPNGRHWNRNVLVDPHVRIGIDGKLYDRTLVYVTDPTEREELLKAFGQTFWSPGFYLHLWRVAPLE
jgi:hypothetical protein